MATSLKLPDIFLRGEGLSFGFLGTVPDLDLPLVCLVSLAGIGGDTLVRSAEVVDSAVLSRTRLVIFGAVLVRRMTSSEAEPEICAV